MNNIAKLLTIVITLVILGIAIFGFTNLGWDNKLISPGFSKNVKTPEPTFAPPNAPKEIKFDRSTNLKEELEKVNPEVKESDFQ